MLDAVAFDRAYRDYSRALVVRVEAMTRGSADAEDIAQDAWVQLWRARETINLRGVWGWICKVVRQVYWQRLRRHGREYLPDMVAEDHAPERAMEPEADAVVEARELREAIAAQPDSMAQTVRLMLHHDDGGEVARIKGVSRQAINATMQRAIATIRRAWGLE